MKEKLNAIVKKIVYGCGIFFIFVMGFGMLFIKDNPTDNDVAEASASIDVSGEKEEQEPLGLEEEIIEEDNKIILNETIITEKLEYTFSKIEFTEKAKSTGDSVVGMSFTPDDGNVYIDVTVSIKNIDKSSVNCDNVLNMQADYNDGYTYKGFTVVEDSSMGLNYALLENISPLQTKDIRYLISCPKEVSETDNPLFITTKLGGTEYIYTIRP